MESLAAHGVDITHVAQIDAQTGHSVIAVDGRGENLIILHPGANRLLVGERVQAALS